MPFYFFSEVSAGLQGLPFFQLHPIQSTSHSFLQHQSFPDQPASSNPASTNVVLSLYWKHSNYPVDFVLQKTGNDFLHHVYKQCCQSNRNIVLLQQHLHKKLPVVCFLLYKKSGKHIFPLHGFFPAIYANASWFWRCKFFDL